MRRAVAGLACLAALASARAALSEPSPQREAFVPTPGRSLAGDDQASALARNPANLAFVPSAELRWTWVRTAATSTDPSRGHSLDVALPLPLNLAVGARVDVLQPPRDAPAPFDAPVTWATWGLAVRARDAFALGASVRHAYGDAPAASGMTSVSLATTVRPMPALGVSVVGRDLNEPRSDAGFVLDRGVDVGLALRPLGTRALEIGVEDRYTRAADQWTPRATLGLDVPYVGRLRGEVSSTASPFASGSHPLTAMVGLELGLGSATYEGGAVFGSGVGGRAGFYTGLALSGHQSPGPPEPGYALRIRIEETPGARGHVQLLRRLWRLAGDPELAAVALLLKAEPADSLAHAEELGDAIRLLRANGKKVVCHFEDAKSRALHVCSQADRIAMNPAGGLRFAGLRAQYQYYGALLAKVGVHAQFVRVGAHKTAPEQFEREGPTDVARDDHVGLLRAYERVLLADVGGGRRIPTLELAATFARGPFVADEARQAHLVDVLAFDDELESVVAETLGRRVRLLDEAPPPPVPSRFGARRGVAVVYLDGDMIDGRSRDIPLLGMRVVGSYTIAETLEAVRKDPLVGAVVLRIESPGGSSMAADVMWREAALTARVKPVVVSMGGSAASGGYYVASAAHRIFASQTTLTGSIGVFYGKLDVAALSDKIGLHVETYRTAPRADAESIFRPFTPDETRELERKVEQFYGVFVDRVATGRHMSKQAVDAVGQGRVWTGGEARERGLVDTIGGLRQALAEARRMADLAVDAPLTELPVVQTSILSTVARLAGVEEPLPVTAYLPPSLGAALRGLAPLTLHAADVPLARAEFVAVDEP